MGTVELHPTPAVAGDDSVEAPLLDVRGLDVTYRSARGLVPAVRDVSFHVKRGEVFGLVGESGSGKSTLTRILVAQEQPTSGRMTHNGRDISDYDGEARRAFRRSVQVVLQNPRASLDPRMRIGASLLEPLRALRVEADHHDRIRTVLEQVGMRPEILTKYPHEFSGGQLQRIAIARALMPAPRVVIADEPVSALDVSIQAQVLNLLKDLVKDLGLTLVLIAHDLSVVAYTTSRVAVMSGGRIVEMGTPEALFHNPQAAATRALVDSVLTVKDGLEGKALR
jgi:ABC-type glutathione transport system ATPase component